MAWYRLKVVHGFLPILELVDYFVNFLFNFLEVLQSSITSSSAGVERSCLPSLCHISSCS